MCCDSVAGSGSTALLQLMSVLLADAQSLELFEPFQHTNHTLLQQGPFTSYTALLMTSWAFQVCITDTVTGCVLGVSTSRANYHHTSSGSLPQVPANHVSAQGKHRSQATCIQQHCYAAAMPQCSPLVKAQCHEPILMARTHTRCDTHKQLGTHPAKKLKRLGNQPEGRPP
jgi:hypothetical protein